MFFEKVPTLLTPYHSFGHNLSSYLQRENANSISIFVLQRLVNEWLKESSIWTMFVICILVSMILNTHKTSTPKVKFQTHFLALSHFYVPLVKMQLSPLTLLCPFHVLNLFVSMWLKHQQPTCDNTLKLNCTL